MIFVVSLQMWRANVAFEVIRAGEPSSTVLEELCSRGNEK
jgi:hypothetical protein